MTTSIELVSPAQDLVRPSLGFGLGYYDEELYSFASMDVDGTAIEAGGRSAFVSHQGSFGINFGPGVTIRISKSVGLDAGARYHMSVDDPATGEVELLSVHAGLSYVVH